MAQNNKYEEMTVGDLEAVYGYLMAAVDSKKVSTSTSHSLLHAESFWKVYRSGKGGTKVNSGLVHQAPPAQARHPEYDLGTARGLLVEQP